MLLDFLLTTNFVGKRPSSSEHVSSTCALVLVDSARGYATFFPSKEMQDRLPLSASQEWVAVVHRRYRFRNRCRRPNFPYSKGFVWT